MQPQKWSLRWLYANNALKKSSLASEKEDETVSALSVFVVVRKLRWPLKKKQNILTHLLLKLN